MQSLSITSYREGEYKVFKLFGYDVDTKAKTVKPQPTESEAAPIWIVVRVSGHCIGNDGTSVTKDDGVSIVSPLDPHVDLKSTFLLVDKSYFGKHIALGRVTGRCFGDDDDLSYTLELRDTDFAYIKSIV